MFIKEHIHDTLGEGKFLRLNQTLEKCLKDSVGGTVYNLSKNNKRQFIDETIIEYTNSCGYLLQQLNKNCSKKTTGRKMQKSSSYLRGKTGSTSLLQVGDEFLKIETSAINCSDEKVFEKFERTAFI